MNGLQYLEKKPLLHMNMIEVIKRNTANVITVNQNGILLRDEISQVYMLSINNKEIVFEFLKTINKANFVLLHQNDIVDIVSEWLGLHLTMQCYQAVWNKSKAPIIKNTEKLEFKVLAMDMLEQVINQYSHDIAVNYIKGRIQAKEMFGAFMEGKLVGFVGLHEEGSIGMVEVLKKYRRKGVASFLISKLCEYQLSKGRVPFSQIVKDNEASLLLHRKMGFSISEDFVYWLER